MANMQFANNAVTTLASGITAAATSMTVTSAAAFPSLTGAQYFYCTLIDAATNLVIEIVKVTATVGTTFTITRAQDGTTASAYITGDKVELRLVRAELNDFPKLDEANTFTQAQTFSALTAGRIPFSGTAGLQSDSANLFWDNTNNRLGINTSGPTYSLDIQNPTTSVVRLKNGTSGSALFYTLNASANTMIALGDAAAIVGGAVDTNAAIYTGTAIPLKFYPSGTLAATLFASGGLSLGNTTDPGATNLSVSGNATFNTAGGTQLGFILSNYTAGGVAAIYNAANVNNSSNYAFASGTTITYINGSSSSRLQAGSSDILIASSTGVAITGTLSSTSTVTGTQLIANGSTSGSSTTGAFAYGTLGYSDTNHLASFQSSVNSYNQVEIQNTNSGTAASADVVVANNLATASTYYGNVGMNSSGFTGTGSFNLPNAVYLSSTGGATASDLVLGTTSSTAPGAIHFVINSGTTDAMTITTSNGIAFGGATNYGTTGQKLISAGNASPVWTSSQLASAFTTGTAATYTVPAGCTTLKVTVQGPGGTGGASATGRATGGSAGSTCIKWLAVTPGGTLTYTVGTAAGTASTVSSGTITITTISAGSGGNGTSTAYAASLTAGPTAGAATGGDINIVGSRGGNSYGSSTTITTNFSGAGGNSPFGAGGQALSMVATAGQAATGFGGGGGGAIGNATGGAATGGIIIFEPY